MNQPTLTCRQVRPFRQAMYLLFSIYCTVAHAGDEVRQNGTQTYNPAIAPASSEGEVAIRTFRVPAELKVELFAAEPLLANPVAFSIDEQGRFYVAETFRLGAGVTDTRGHMDWLDDDLACRTVADRVAMYKKFLGKEFEQYKVEHERVRLVVDRDHDGRADSATVFADGFNDPSAGIGAGLLARKGEVWYACIPWLWKLRDTTGAGKATERVLLHEGYGVHVGFLGHDLHGLRMGPDGKLYFSIGDRGFNVKTREGRQLAVLDTGSVLRCNPDGTELEVFATGLRNPQELAFDQFGNLFTCDNNSDSGDRARCVYLVEGGDSGWRIGYQFIEEPISRGPWNEEKLWEPRRALEAAYLVPPVANISDGPSGLTYDPGISLLPDRYRDHFFLVDFRGASGQSGIRSFAVKPKGASFELIDSQESVWRTLATDVDFGPDGALYFSDWVEGWSKPNKGRIYRVLDPARKTDPAIREAQRIRADGMEKRSVDDLAALLAHAAMDIRQAAQFELVRRTERGRLSAIAQSGQSRLARIHAVWGLGQLARSHGQAEAQSLWPALEPLLADQDFEIRAQAARVLGEAREPAALAGLITLLVDTEPRVRFFAAIALGKIGRGEALQPLLAMLRANADQDPYLRHAGVMGLVGLKDRNSLRHAFRDPSPAVRMGVLLALRRYEDPAVAVFLNDPEPRLVLEAARAINDVPIEAAMPQLASLLITSNAPLPLLRRVANAAFRQGRGQDARMLAETAGRADLPEAIRLLAVTMLGEWERPSGRDKVMGLWRPISPRPAGAAAEALRPKLEVLLASGPEAIRQEAIRAVGSLAMKEAAPRLTGLVAKPRTSDEMLVEVLKSLEKLHDGGQADLAKRILKSSSPNARVEAVRVLFQTDPVVARAAVDQMLQTGTARERQGVFAILADRPYPAAEEVLLAWLDRLNAGKVPAEIQLDLIAAAERKPSPAVQARLESYAASKPKNDPLAPYRETLAGGSARRGRRIFLTKAEVSCLRCHKVAGSDGKPTGGEVGPELSGIGGRQNREYILESLVTPNQKIAQGFESVILATSDGKIVTGVLRGEDEKQLRLMTAEGQLLTVSKENIEERKRGPSAMPVDIITKLSKAELRDLVEFLAGLKAK